ncbi:hypothetical protein I3256_18800 [Photobacterium damselae]|uniref:LPD7 domain-containing protein n=1 Tax=Photobacterium damselae TaxID=38293 RepID=UPI001EDD1513|nr:LPD7 domain-containing protein [Photobacterium damselae]MCG3817993.1 hypothetical protein [Photobacterium damselae]
MLIRITHKKEGIEHYLETGQKANREATRDELDHRVHLSGDLDAFALTVQYTRENKQRWKDHYWHITASFAIEDNHLDDETLRAINKEMMEYYFCAYDVDKLIHATEAHRPKIQSQVNKATGEIEQRLLHIHNAVSKYDVTTGNQVRMIPFNEAADRAFQSYICAKYGLVDPADRKRDIPVTKRDIIAKWKGDPDTAKQTKVADLRKLFSQLVNDVTNLDEAKQLIMETGMAHNVVFKKQKSGNRYLHVETIGDTRNINLRGNGFENLEKIYYADQERPEAPSAQSGDHESIWKQHKKWWLEQQKQRAPKTDRKINYEKSHKKYASYYEKYSREQRRYFVIYRTNIQEEAIRGYRIFEKANERYLINNELGVKIYDRPDKIVLDLPDNADKRKNAVSLALQVARDKGWNLDTLNITGSFEFQQEVKRQIAEIKSANAPTQSAKPITEKPESKPKLNVIDQALNDVKEQQQKRLSKDRIATIKAGLDAQSVIDYAREKYGLMSEHFTVTNDNKIKDNRSKAKPRNVIDFLTKTCSVGIGEAMPELHELYQQQIKKEAYNVDISVCTSANPNGLTGWQHKQPKTFTELATLVKSHSYAGFTGLKDQYRKAENITALGNCAIFDIDNDPDQLQLSIADAQELLKETTYLLVTSRSHQQEKVKPKGGVLPAVDRYRIIVPMNKPLSTDRDEYRLAMVKLSEQLGLDSYADQKALKDIARQYYQSPPDAQVLVNNTKQAFDSAPLLGFAQVELARLEAEKAAARQAILDRATTDKTEFSRDHSEHPIIVDLDAINRLPLPEVYQMITGQEVSQDGSYIMAKGVTAGTSQSRASLTMFEANENWLWHDFKSGESGNVVTFMREAAGMNAFESAQMLSERFKVDLMTPNPAYYEKALKTSLETAKNDKELELAVKEQTGATFVKIAGDELQIADKRFKLSDLNISKKELIDNLKDNRSPNTGWTPKM